METICKIRDLYRSISEFESRFEEAYDLCLNEVMLLCSLSDIEHLSSGQISELLGLKLSHTSKVIKIVEDKGLIERVIGKTDKRQMYFSLTNDGKRKLETIQCDKVEIPDLLISILDK